MERYICIHGHFYQPPRENPWLEAIEVQDSAYPYHDWNERITTECYAPNALARMLDEAGKIARLVNNYARISFNFGPTLLSWLEEKVPDVYRAVLEADRESQKLFSGYGSAMAQAYNHMIMPLANRRDKHTQVLWGIRDFERRFERKPEGMWLPETAVDLESLEVLAELGIRFTVLSPYQARRVRPLAESQEAPESEEATETKAAISWRDVTGGRIDPTMAYLQRLPSGKSIHLFFYDGPISRAIAFEGLLIRGDYLAGRLLDAFSDNRNWPQLIHVATDGETYGHHHRYGEMALVYALDHIQNSDRARLTNYAEYLALHPPTHEVEILENTAWSCVHGVERWRNHCGCNSGREGWNQEWRQPLRQSLDWLRDQLMAPFEQHLAPLVNDPWEAREEFIDVILDRSPPNVDRFLRRHARRELTPEEEGCVLKWLELQRNAQLMYTSCGWFFDELTGIETVQVMQYAGRVLQLAQGLIEDGGRAHKSTNSTEDGQADLEEGFVSHLELAQSNVPEYGSGRQVYDRFIRPSVVDWRKIGAHYAISSLFETYSQETRLFCYLAERDDYHSFKAGKAQLVVGRAHLTSLITRATSEMSFGVLHFGDHNIHGGVREFLHLSDYQTLLKELSEAFQRADFPGVIRLLDRHFGEFTYSLGSLFRDEQRAVLKRVLQGSLSDAESVYRRLYDQNLPTMRFLAAAGAPLPRAFQQTADFLINTDLLWAFEEDEPDLEHIRTLIQEANTWHIQVDAPGLGYRMKNTLARIAERVRAQPDNLGALRLMESVVKLGRILPVDLNTWQAQNVWFELSKTVVPEQLEQLGSGEGREESEAWLQQFISLGETLNVRVIDLKKKVDEAGQGPTPVEAVRNVLAGRHTPEVTYRLQFHKQFGFGAALALLPYLAELGVTDLHISPILETRPGSVQGDDICDHGKINPELGGEADFLSLADAVRAQGLGLLLDTVPNHMVIGHSAQTGGSPSEMGVTVRKGQTSSKVPAESSTPAQQGRVNWWADVLENGPSSEYALYFDIDWKPNNPDLHNKVLLPILEDQYGRVLEQGKFQLIYEEGAFVIQYRSQRLPVAPRTYEPILREALTRISYGLGERGGNSSFVEELQSILTAISYLPGRDERSVSRRQERLREKEIIKRRLATLYTDSVSFRTALGSALRAFNGTPGDSASFDRIHALLDAQAYRPAYWRVATEEINYRRSGAFNDLAAIRVEHPEVFQATHKVPLRLLAQGRVTGLLVRFPDGLWNPSTYFKQLQKSCLHHCARNFLGPHHSGKGVEAIVEQSLQALNRRDPDQAQDWPVYVVADKILTENEPLPTDWAVDGTSGYDFLNVVNGLFVDRQHAQIFDDLYTNFIGEEGATRPEVLARARGAQLDFRQGMYTAKRLTLLGSLASEVDDLAHRLDRLAETTRRYRDFTLISLTRAVREIIVYLPVYRTYIVGTGLTELACSQGPRVSERDRYFLEMAVESARRANTRTPSAVFDFVRDTLLLRNLEHFREQDRPRLIEWVMRFQQVTGNAMAKGAEDFSIYNRLVSLNEVGGTPMNFGVSSEAFHQLNQHHLQRWPHTLLATTTRVTSWREDVRARLAVLSEMPTEWRAALDRWAERNRGHKTLVDGRLAPDRNDEYLFYQVLVGSWPATPCSPEEFKDFRTAVVRYMARATREAQVHTSWINPSTEYDQAVRNFVLRALSDPTVGKLTAEFSPSEEKPEKGFLADLSAFQKRVAFHGQFNALAQVLLKLTSPGVPDLYEGTELWDFDLADPEGRRQVDYQLRRKLLAGLRDRVGKSGSDLLRLAQGLLLQSNDGRAKLYLIWRTLQKRHAHRELFTQGAYEPVEAEGEKRDHVCAFARILEDHEVLVVVPRLVVKLTAGAERAPQGPSVWKDTRLVLPDGVRARHYRNLYTGEVLSVREVAGRFTLTVSAVFAHWPVAFLEGMKSS